MFSAPSSSQPPPSSSLTTAFRLSWESSGWGLAKLFPYPKYFLLRVGEGLRTTDQRLEARIKGHLLLGLFFSSYYSL